MEAATPRCVLTTQHCPITLLSLAIELVLVLLRDRTADIVLLTPVRYNMHVRSLRILHDILIRETIMVASGFKIQAARSIVYLTTTTANVNSYDGTPARVAEAFFAFLLNAFALATPFFRPAWTILFSGRRSSNNQDESGHNQNRHQGSIPQSLR